MSGSRKNYPGVEAEIAELFKDTFEQHRKAFLQATQNGSPFFISHTPIDAFHEINQYQHDVQELNKIDQPVKQNASKQALLAATEEAIGSSLVTKREARHFFSAGPLTTFGKKTDGAEIAPTSTQEKTEKPASKK